MENSLVKWICARYKFVYRMFVNKNNNNNNDLNNIKESEFLNNCNVKKVESDKNFVNKKDKIDNNSKNIDSNKNMIEEIELERLRHRLQIWSTIFQRLICLTLQNQWERVTTIF